MAVAKKTTRPIKTISAKVTRPKKTTKKIEALDFVPEDTNSEIQDSPRRSFVNKRFFIFLIIIGLLILAYNKKALFIAATVNNQPITNLELIQKMNQTYRERTLNQMVNEAILDQEAKKNNITISDAEINQKMDEVIKTYGGQDSFEQLLTQQGLTKADFTKQTRLQLVVEKLYATEIKPTDTEIQKFMDDNKTAPEATEPAKFKVAAEDAVKQDKLSKVFAEKFKGLKDSAKITIF
jgi:foldase protein PrsA